MFASAIQLNLSNHSFGSSVSVPPNSPGFTKLPSLDAYSPPIFIPVKTFTKAATFGSNPPGLLIFAGLPPSPGGPPGGFLLQNLLQNLLQILVVDFGYC